MEQEIDIRNVQAKNQKQLCDAIMLLARFTKKVPTECVYYKTVYLSIEYQGTPSLVQTATLERTDQQRLANANTFV